MVFYQLKKAPQGAFLLAVNYCTGAGKYN